MAMVRSQHDLHQRGDDAVGGAVVGGHRDRAARRPDRLAGPRRGRRGAAPAAHPNSRFTVLAQQCPSIAPNWEDPQGVPISGVIFGSRPRARGRRSCSRRFDWNHGVFLGSAMGTETTAAITGEVGVVRRDPMAMLPFCGYNMADYFGALARHGHRARDAAEDLPRELVPPRRRRQFLWPGYGDNVRVLKWIVERIHGKADAPRDADRLRAGAGRPRARRIATSRPTAWRPPFT